MRECPIDISFEEEIQLGDIVLWDENIVSEVLTYAIDQDSLINVSVTSPFGCVLDDSTQVNVFLNQDFENLPDTHFILFFRRNYFRRYY